MRSQYGDGLRYDIRDAVETPFHLAAASLPHASVVDISVIPYHPRMFPCGLSSSDLLTCVSVSNVTGKAASCHNEYFGAVQPWQ
jgi:hypothetical protein